MLFGFCVTCLLPHCESRAWTCVSNRVNERHKKGCVHPLPTFLSPPGRRVSQSALARGERVCGLGALIQLKLLQMCRENAIHGLGHIVRFYDAAGSLLTCLLPRPLTTALPPTPLSSSISLCLFILHSLFRFLIELKSKDSHQVG